MADHRQAGSLWTPEEDVLLLRHVAKYGTKHWGYLQTSGILPHRDQKACCNRFILLKRKFFQARAKGQRLTYPVVPQPELPAAKRGSSPSASTGNQSSPSRMLPAASNTSFKRTSGSSGSLRNNMLKAIELTEDNRSQSILSELDKFSAAYNHEQAAALHRTMENLPQNPVFRHEAPRSSGLKTSAPMMAKVEQLSNSSSGNRPMLTQHSPQAAMNKVLNLAGLSSKNVQDAAWRCFNPDDISFLLSEFSDQNSPTVPDISSAGGMNGGLLSPDAMLEQMSSAPMKSLNGNPSMLAAAESLLDSLTHGDAAQCSQPLNSTIDLWDLLRASATV